jgi:hypothetical protein
MARTNIVPWDRLGAYPTEAGLASGAALPSLTSTSDPTDRSTALIDNKTSVLAHNTDIAAQTITITSVPDAQNRVAHLVQALQPGEIALLGPFKNAGWASAGNLLLIDVTDPKLQISVIKEV